MSIFDGMAGILNDVFGAPVVIHPGGGNGRSIQAVVRREPVEVATDEGEAVLSLRPTLKALKGEVSDLVDGDRVVAEGETYSVSYRIPNGPPAADRFETFVLQKEI